MVIQQQCPVLLPRWSVRALSERGGWRDLIPVKLYPSWGHSCGLGVMDCSPWRLIAVSGQLMWSLTIAIEAINVVPKRADCRPGQFRLQSVSINTPIKLPLDKRIDSLPTGADSARSAAIAA